MIIPGKRRARGLLDLPELDEQAKGAGPRDEEGGAGVDQVGEDDDLAG